MIWHRNCFFAYKNFRSQVDEQKTLLKEREKELQSQHENNSKNTESIKGLQAELASRGDIVMAVLPMSIIQILCLLVSKLMVRYRYRYQKVKRWARKQRKRYDTLRR